MHGYQQDSGTALIQLLKCICTMINIQFVLVTVRMTSPAVFITKCGFILHYSTDEALTTVAASQQDFK